MSTRQRHQINKLVAKGKRITRPWPAVVGDGTGVIEVPGKPGEWYVRPAGMDIPVPVLRGNAPRIEGYPVWVSVDVYNKKWVRILGTNIDALASNGSITHLSDVEPHSGSHYLTGSDIVYITTRQVTDLLLTLVSGLTVRIAGGFVIVGGQPVYVAATNIDLTSHIPSGQARWVLIRANSSGVLSVQDGTAVDSFADLTTANIPAVADDYAALWAVRLYDGQTAVAVGVVNTDVYDLRFAPMDAGGGGSASAFTDLTDVPASYNDQALKEVRVNAAADALEFHYGLGWYNVKDYGAVGDGATDDTTAIGDAVTALNAAGRGVLYFPAGDYLTSGGYTISVPALILGCGHHYAGVSSDAVSQLLCNSATASVFTIAEHACQIRNLSFYNNAGSTPSNGAAITVTAGTRMIMDGISVELFYNDIDIQDGATWILSNSFIYDPVKYGLKIAHVDYPDGGDWIISNCTLSANNRSADAAVYILSAGGGKIVNCKINSTSALTHAFDYGIQLAPTAAMDTSILLVSNTSIENVKINGFRMVTGADVTWGMIELTGCQISLYDNTDDHAVYFAANASGDIFSVVVNGCIFRASAASSVEAVKMVNVVAGRIVACINDGFTDLLETTTCTDVVIVGDGLSFSDAEGDPEAVDETAAADGTSTYAARRDHRHKLGTVNLNDLDDVDTTGTGAGDVIYNSGSGWVDYPLGVGSIIAVVGQKLRIGDVAGGDYLQIDTTTGNIRLIGAATTYEDLRIDGLNTRPGVVAPTDEAGFRGDNNFYVRNFVNTQADEVQFDVQLPHSWLEGGKLYPHVHFAPWITSTGDKAAKFILEYYWANVGEQFPANPSTYEMTETWNGDQQWYHLIAGNATELTATGKTLSSIMKCRLYRDNTVTNNLAGKVTFLYFDIHYEVDGFGSDEEYVKDTRASLLLESGDYLLLESGDKLLLE